MSDCDGFYNGIFIKIMYEHLLFQHKTVLDHTQPCRILFILIRCPRNISTLSTLKHWYLQKKCFVNDELEKDKKNATNLSLWTNVVSFKQFSKLLHLKRLEYYRRKQLDDEWNRWMRRTENVFPWVLFFHFLSEFLSLSNFYTTYVLNNGTVQSK